MGEQIDVKVDVADGVLPLAAARISSEAGQRSSWPGRGLIGDQLEVGISGCGDHHRRACAAA
jgi:hypothetical protein